MAPAALHNEAGLRAVAKFFKDSGMQGSGYEYINTDEGWEEKTRDPHGNHLVINGVSNLVR